MVPRRGRLRREASAALGGSVAEAMGLMDLSGAAAVPVAATSTGAGGTAETAMSWSCSDDDDGDDDDDDDDDDSDDDDGCADVAPTGAKDVVVVEAEAAEEGMEVEVVAGRMCGSVDGGGVEDAMITRSYKQRRRGGDDEEAMRMLSAPHFDVDFAAASAVVKNRKN
ncbi:hypothetical protein L1887_55322 [Cichorium endivia]|nr:hypothetical protein L1887_55322 [Cichorium endivia]